jgi:hypothetical protein
MALIPFVINVLKCTELVQDIISIITKYIYLYIKYDCIVRINKYSGVYKTLQNNLFYKKCYEGTTLETNLILYQEGLRKTSYLCKPIADITYDDLQVIFHMKKIEDMRRTIENMLSSGPVNTEHINIAIEMLKQ